MAEEKKLEKIPEAGVTLDDAFSFDYDNAKLAEMGYVPELKRNFGTLTLLGICFSLTNSWFGISASLVTGISSGGPIVTVYGILWIAIMHSCVGITLSELASAMPNSGGQYYWAQELAPEGWENFLAYCTGMISWAGSIFTCASTALAISSGLMGMIQINNPSIVIERWMVWVTYQIFNFVAFLFNCYGKALPTIGSVFMYISLCSFTIITITVLAKSPTKKSAKFVFAEFRNETGWTSGGIAFIMGLINPNWSFSCLDSATHLAEEVTHPERVIPIAIMGTVAIGFVTAFCYSIAMFFSMDDLPAMVNTPTLVPILELYRQAVGSVAGATGLEFLICLTGLGCQIACHTWQARLCWSFARDRGLPGSRYWAKVNKKTGIPLNAHAMSCTLVGILGTLYIGSITAFNSMCTACIVLLYMSYAIPVVCLLKKGRENIEHGPFWLGKFGLITNIVTLAWSTFAFVMYSFPYVKPVAAGNMNYVSAVYFVVWAITLGYWQIRGKRTFRTKGERGQVRETILGHKPKSVDTSPDDVPVTTTTVQ